MSTEKKIQAAKKVFKIDVLSKNLCLKRTIIREWEKKFDLRKDLLQAPDKLYTNKDAELFRSIKRIKIDKQESDKVVLKHLETLLKNKQERASKSPESNRSKSKQSFSSIDQFIGFEPTSVAKEPHKKKPDPLPVRSSNDDYITISKVQLNKLKKKVIELRTQLFGNKDSSAPTTQDQEQA